MIARRDDGERIPPMLARISDYVEFHAQRQPDAQAMVLGEDRATYRQLRAQVDALARALVAAGVQRGDRVATLSTPHPDYWVSLLATASIGAIWVGLNPRHQLAEYRYVLGDCEPAVLFTRSRIGDRDYAADIAALRASVPALRQVVVFDGDPALPHSLHMADFLALGATLDEAQLATRRAAVRPEDPALIIYTSGTTGQPKGALLPHRGLVRCCRNQMRYWRADPVRMVNFLPINHIGCVGDISCWALVAGGCVVFMEKFDAAESIALSARENCTAWGGVPTTIIMTLELPQFAEYDLSALQLIVWSGAAAPEELVRRLARLGPELSNAYGMTETVGSITYAGPGKDIDLLANSVGFPVPDYEFRLAGPDGTPVPQSEPGEVCVRGDFMMLGYWRRPDETAQAIDAEGWLHTGDLAVQRPDGSIRLVGRLKEMFKSGGYNIYPREIEQVLEAFPGVAMVAVVGVPDPLYGEAGHAYILREPGARLSAAELEAACRARLANYKIPKSFVIADELPLLPVGKLDRRRLREQAIARPS